MSPAFSLRICFFFFVLLPVFRTTAQSVTTDTLDRWNSTSEALRYASPARSAALAKTVLQQSAKLANARKQRQTAWINWSYALVEAGAIDSAEILSDSANVAAAGLRDSATRSALYVLRGYICDYKENDQDALRNYFNGLTLCPDRKHRAAICNNIGTVYKVMQDLGNAEKYYRLSYAIGQELGDSVRQAKSLNNLGGVYLSRGDLSAALDHYRQSLRIREALHDSVGMYSNLTNIALVYEKQNKLDTALQLHRQSLAMAERIRHPVDMVVALINIGNLEVKKGNTREALATYNRGAAIADSLRLHYYSRLVHRSLANYYATTGDYHRAYDNFMLYTSYNDSVLSERSQQITKELELRYRTRESAEKIRLLNEQQRAAQLEKQSNLLKIERQRNMLWLIFFIALSVIIAVILIYLRYRAQRRHAAELETLVREKDILLREIHHRVKNNLQLVSSLLSLQDGASGSGKEVLRQSQDRIHTLALLHEKLYQSADLRAISFRDYAGLLLGYIQTSFASEQRAIHVRCTVDDITLDIDQLVPCGLIINELVTNSFRHAFPNGSGTIDVSTECRDGRCQLHVTDDGVGADERNLQGRSGSLGLRLVKGLSRQLRGELHTQTSPGKGTAVRITFPLHSVTTILPSR